MIRTLLFWLLLGAITTAQGQSYGNEWIQYDRTYYRFDIVTEGVYRIDSLALANAGIPIAAIDPNDIQIYARQKQVPVYLEGADDGILNGADFIEFFAYGADGSSDLPLWDDPAHQNNPYYSLYNDTIRYYLTWATATPPARILPYDSTDLTGLTQRPWFWSKGLTSLVTFYQVGQRDAQGASSPFFVNGEGWFDTEYGKGDWQNNPNLLIRDRTVTNPRPLIQPGVPDARCTVTWAGTNNPKGVANDDHHTIILYGDPPVNQVLDTTFNGYKTLRKTFSIPNAQIGISTTKVRMEIVHDLQPDPTDPDYQAISNIEIEYPHETHMGNTNKIHIWLDDELNDPDAYLNFSGFGGTPLIYTIGAQMHRITPFSGSGWNARIPADPDNARTHAYVFATTTVQYVTSFEPVNNTGSFTDISQLEEDSAMIIVTHNSLLNSAMQYAAYRESAITNRYNTVLVNVDELYDQFGDGVPKHALSLRRFAQYLAEEWTSMPRAMFLIGKSVKEVGFTGSDLGTRKTQSAYALSLIPTLGYPPSDPAFTVGLGSDPAEVAFPIGRLSASNEQEVLDYLAKVQTFESQPRAEWMKRILHFVGGTNEGEQNYLAAWMEQMETIAEDTCFGGKVSTFKKFSSQIIQQLESDSVTGLINGGVTLMTFFAHASGSSFDISIDNPLNYDWNGHYPFMIGNSCYTGNIHLSTSSSTSEQFVLLQDKGAIGFMASVDIGLAANLGDYSRKWYQSFSQLNYGKSVGEHIRTAIEYQLTNNPTLLNINNALTMTLMGDPTLILNSWPEPDYVIEQDDISFIPANVTTDLDTFQVQVRVSNIGKATNEPVGVALERSVDGTTLQPVKAAQVNDLGFEQIVTFDVPVIEQEVGAGTNNFQARVDLDPDLVVEMEDLANNSAQRELLITSGNIVPIYPYEFAIVPQSGPELKASTGDPFAPARDYLFQIDTTDLFNSPIMESTTINHVGGVVTWQPQLIYALDNFQDSVVYYWRCSPDSVGLGSYKWLESSFQHIPNKRGWGQAHYFQFKDNKHDLLVYDRPQREWDFFQGNRTIRADVQGNSTGTTNNLTQWFIDLLLQEYNGCGATPALHVAVVDPNTFTAWGTRYNGENPNNDFGNLNDNGTCRSRVEKYFIFRTNDLDQMNSFENMLLNDIPDGHYMLVWSWRYLNRFGADALNTGAIDAIETLGGANVRQIPDSVPYILFVRKGYPATAEETWGATIDQLITLSVSVPVLGNTGLMSTPKAGPATAWHALYFDETPRNPQDSTWIRVIGVSPNGTETQLVQLPSYVDSLPDLENYADASIYPELRLHGYFKDDSVATPEPAQMQRWQLLLDPVPECAIDPSLGFYQEFDSLYEGMSGKVAIAIHNVSEFDMDSLLIGAWILDASNHRVGIHYRRHAPLPAGAVYLDTIRFDLIGLGGLNSLIVEANPIDSTTGLYDQLEQYHFNNIAQLRFRTLEDIENPILDITFDGIHILDGDIVSSRPEILIELDDENEVLLLDNPADTSNFKVFEVSPDQGLRRLYFRDGQGIEQLQFVPADGPDNVCQIFYRPTYTVDGSYKLIVQASDLSANASGDHDYEVGYEVISRPTITEILNYPNPFTTSTRFVFTVTGQQAPTYMKIQIMTVSGRVVREITNDELGVLRVGRNITEFAWDGTDQFGDKLARGVYLYRVIAKLHGEDIEYRETSASTYFKKGFGKMYLLR